MAQEAIPLDITNMPEVSNLVREVSRTRQPRLLQVDGDTAVLSPARPNRRNAKGASQQEFEAALNATFGTWEGLIDPDEFQRERRELQEHDREPYSL